MDNPGRQERLGPCEQRYKKFGLHPGHAYSRELTSVRSGVLAVRDVIFVQWVVPQLEQVVHRKKVPIMVLARKHNIWRELSLL